MSLTHAMIHSNASSGETIALINLGCARNMVDGERILGHLESKGYRVVDDPAGARIILVNTCTFIMEATRETIDTIFAAAAYKDKGSCQTLVVCGCFSQRYRDTIRRGIPEVDYWIGVRSWQSEIDRLFPRPGSRQSTRKLSPPRATQYCTIGDGCSHRCSFCIIPSIRGPLHSRPIPEIIDETRWLYEQGTRELILVSQDTSCYGRDRGRNLLMLLERVLRDTPVPWIRLMYLHPAHVSGDLLRLAAAERRLCSYFDIPLQHISDTILTAMRRRPSGAAVRRLLEKIRTLVPNAAIRTSFIVGFPGEREKEFNELLAFVEEMRFEKLGVFPYSPEKGTEAYSFRNRPRNATALRRGEILMDLQQEISREICAGRIGSTVTAIIDSVSELDGFHFEARTQWDAPEVDGRIHVRGGGHTVGSFARLRITDADAYDLYAAAD